MGWPGLQIKQCKTVTCILLGLAAAVAQVTFPWLVVLQVPAMCAGDCTDQVEETKPLYLVSGGKAAEENLAAQSASGLFKVSFQLGRELHVLICHLWQWAFEPFLCQ